MRIARTGIKFGAIAGLTLLASAVAGGWTAPRHAAAQEAVTVSMYEGVFDPVDLVVPAGTTLVWANVSEAIHNVIADDGTFDSGIVAAGGSFSFTYSAAGAYVYRCTLHDGMVGSVTVQ